MKKIDHIAVAVESIKDSVKIYIDLLGVEPEIEQIADEHVNTAMFKLNGASIELVEPIDENSPVSKFLQKRGTGIHHICLEVDDLEASISDLKNKGYELINTSPNKGAGGEKTVFLHPKSTGGVMFELNFQPTEDNDGTDRS